MQPLPDELAEPLARARQRLGGLGGHLLWFEEVSSTNDVASRLATDTGAGEGCVVVANAQRLGRGRRGREWASPPGAGLYVSVVLRPTPHAVSLLTIAAGVAVAEGVQAASGLDTRVKWPNDVYIGGRKVAGILAEGGVSADGQPHVILGFGINVRPAAWPPDVAARATSLDGELGRETDRGLVLSECLAALWARYTELQEHRGGSVVQAWRARAAGMLGREVEWEAAGATQRGVAENIDEAGALLVRTAAGSARIISGEVRWL